MTLLIGSLTIGLILSFLALGVLISFRIFKFPDITADGSITLGASVAAVLLVNGYNPVAATLCGAIAGCGAGLLTGILHTRFNIHGLLAGILVMTALYSVNLHVMGRSNLPLTNETTAASWAEDVALAMHDGKDNILLAGWEVAARDIVVLAGLLTLVAAVGMTFYLFFKTDLGTAMRATGDNQQMARALGVNTSTMIILGLALSNGLIAFAGALLAQYQGFADVQMGIGMVVWGLASVIIGEALVGSKSFGLAVTGAAFGSILFRLLVAVALRWGLNPNDLKIVTALFVLAALVLPGVLRNMRPPAAGVDHG